MAILGVLSVGLLQILGLSMQTWQQGRIKTNCYTKGRVVLDSVTADIQRGIFRTGLQNFPTPASSTSPTFTFYTRAAGVAAGSGSVRPVTLVTYQLSANSNLQGYLLRSVNAITWGTGSNFNFMQQITPVAAATAPTTSVPPDDFLSKGIAGFEMIFLLSDGTTVLAKQYQSPSSASIVMIGVAVAVIDDQAMTQLQPTTSPNFSNIQKALENALTQSFSAMTPTVNSTTGVTTYTSTNYKRSIKELWDPALVPFYQNAAYPKILGTGIDVFERFVPCTPFN
jgi:hypothetical protein